MAKTFWIPICMGMTTGVLHAGAVVFGLLAGFAHHPQLCFLGTIPEVIGVVVRRRFAALWALESLAYPMTLRAVARRGVFCKIVLHMMLITDKQTKYE